MQASGQRNFRTRVDGPAKVTGTAKFAADWEIGGLAHAAVVTSTIARGRITGFDVQAAQKMRGVLGVFTFREIAGEIRPVKHLMVGGYANSTVLPLGSPEIHYAGQIVALVAAESRETAEEAARSIRVEYAAEKATALLEEVTDETVPLEKVREGYSDPAHGDARAAFEAAAFKLDATYETPIQHHNPMELFGTTCVWAGDQLTVYEATRHVDAAQHGLAAQLGIDASKVRVVCPFMGGHFGSRLALSQYTAPVAVAARKLGRPVQYVARRSEGFTIANHRPETRQHIRIGATKEGEFIALRHEAKVMTSRFDSFAMEGTDVTASLYAWRNVETKEIIVRVDRNTPGPMRAPPEVPYLFALESAIDETAAGLGIDPIELRRRNDTAVDPIKGKPFVPRELMRCFEAGAKAFGWAERNPKPGSERRGEWHIGLGCASAVRPAKRSAATMRVALFANGRVTVETAHHEIGNGIYTVLAMQAAEQLGTEVERVSVRLGDTTLPPAGLSGGSSTTTSLVPVLKTACERLREQLADAAVMDKTFTGAAKDELRLARGSMVARDGRSVRLAEAFARLGRDRIEAVAEGVPEGGNREALGKLREGKLALGGDEKSLKWAYGAQFAEVHVHSVTGEIRVRRLTGAFAAGRILNRLTALNQLQGGMIWGLGAALFEESVVDRKTCRYANDNLADYLVATAADAPEVNAILLEPETDRAELMGLGELGVIGVNAAIANALWHATGRRYRKFPIRMEEML